MNGSIGGNIIVDDSDRIKSRGGKRKSIYVPIQHGNKLESTRRRRVGEPLIIEPIVHRLGVFRGY